MVVTRRGGRGSLLSELAANLLRRLTRPPSVRGAHTDLAASDRPFAMGRTGEATALACQFYPGRNVLKRGPSLVASRLSPRTYPRNPTEFSCFR